MARVSDVMTRDVQVVRPDDSLQRAAQCMRDRDVGAIPVCEGRRLIGIITDRDIAVRGGAAGWSMAATRVGDVMTKHLRWCNEGASTHEVLDDMGAHQIRRLPVLNAQRELVGIVSLADLTKHQQAQVSEALRRISTPARAAY